MPLRYRVAIALLTMLSLLLAAVLVRERRRSRRAQLAASIDPLTGLLNRRAFEQTLAAEWRRAERYDRRLGLIFIDVNDFKDYNDSKGHLAGDALLADLAGRVRTGVRDVDIAARLGGDEFIVGCPETDLNGLRLLAGRLEALFAGLPVTSSIGVAERRTGDRDLNDLLARADRHMYAVKAIAHAG